MALDMKYLESEACLSSFALEFIKDKVLVESYLTHSKKHNRRKKLDAIVALTLKLGVNSSVMAMINMCSKLRSTLISRMRSLQKHCIYRGWPINRCLLLAPHWLRVVETKIRVVPRNIQLTAKRAKPPPSKYMVFFSKLLKNAYKAAKGGQSIYSPSVVSSIASEYGASDVSILSLWKRTCDLIKWSIISKTEKFDVFPYFNMNCQIEDCLLLYDTSFRVVTLESFSNEEEVKGLLKLYKLIIKYDVESLLKDKSPDLIAAWLKLFAVYSCKGKTSLLYLQRCWYELKLVARCSLISYWRRENDSVPHPLLISILSKFTYINLEPFPDWSELVKTGLVVELKDVTEEVYEETLNEAIKDDDMSHCMCTDHKNSPTKINSEESLATTNDREEPTVGYSENLLHEIEKENVEKPAEEARIVIEVENETVKPMDNEKYTENNCREFKKDYKQLVEISIPLVRCDLTTGWRKYYRNGTINLRNFDLKQLIPKNFVKRNRINESVKCLSGDRDYSLIVLRTNPDFNPKLKRLSAKFLQSSHNQQLLDLCKPVTVILNRMDMNTVSAVATPMRKAKKVELPDIDEVRKINSTILTAEVAPVAVHSPTRVLQITGNTSPSEGQSTVTSNQLPNHIIKLMGLNEHEPDITDAQLKKILDELLAKAEKTTEVLNDGNKSDTERKCGSTEEEVHKSQQKQLMCDIWKRSILESREIANSVKNIIRIRLYAQKNHFNSDGEQDYVQEANDNDSIMSDHSSTNDDCLIIDETEEKNKEAENERKTKRWRKRKVKRKEKNLEEEPNSKKIKSKKTEEKDEKCPDAYDEWTRQKNLALKYFSLPSLIKPAHREADKISKVSEHSDANTSGQKSVACPKVIKAFYESSPAAGRNLNYNCHLVKLTQAGVSRTVNLEPLKVSCNAAIQTPTQANDAAQARVIDLTESPTPSRPESPSETSPSTIVRAINFSNANITATGPTIQRTRDKGQAIAVCTNSCEKQTPPADNTLPIITGVSSLANVCYMNDNKNTKRTAPQTIKPSTKPVTPASDSQSAPIYKSTLKDLVTSAHVPPIWLSAENISQMMQAPWLPLPATNTAAPNLQPAVRRVVVPSPPAQEKSSPNTKCRRKLAQVKTVNTEAGRYFILVPDSMLNDVPKTSELLMKSGLSPSKTMLVPVSPNESTEQLAVLKEALQSSKTAQSQSQPIVVLQTAQTNSLHNISLPVETWARSKTTADELKILRVDASKPHWTPKAGYLLVTDSDLMCAVPTYWSVEPLETRNRILFPAENNGFAIYNPEAVQISKTAAIGTTAFAKWVRSVLENNSEMMVNPDVVSYSTAKTLKTVANSAEHIIKPVSTWSKPVDYVQEGRADFPRSYKVGDVNGTVLENPLVCKVVPLNSNEIDVEREGAKPVARLKVKSFARIRDEEIEQTLPPERVCLQGKIYHKVSDDPLKYAQVLTVVSSTQESVRLSTQDVMFYILPNNTESVCAQVQV